MSPLPEWCAELVREWEHRFAAHKDEVRNLLDKHHAENRIRLQSIDSQSIENGVKLDKLYGVEGQPGAVDRLSDKVGKLGDKIMYASGFLAAVVILVGWYIEHK